MLLTDGTSTIACAGEPASDQPAAGTIELRARGSASLQLVDAACAYDLVEHDGRLEASLPQTCADGLTTYSLTGVTLTDAGHDGLSLSYEVVATTMEGGAVRTCRITTTSALRRAAAAGTCSPLGSWAIAATDSAADSPVTLSVSPDMWVIASAGLVITSSWVRTADGVSFADVSSVPPGAACPPNQAGSYVQVFVDDCSFFTLESRLDRCDSRRQALDYVTFLRR
jgi:hypothetical protein